MGEEGAMECGREGGGGRRASPDVVLVAGAAGALAHHVDGAELCGGRVLAAVALRRVLAALVRVILAIC